ncbi:MAG TPA: hypothetical protein VGZ25_13390 [Gemmataceae bacterium]|nr:hypothetical protein [Gemmataceae bacterium]
MPSISDPHKLFRKAGCLLTLVFCLVLPFYAIQLFFEPYDKVNVTIEDCPLDTRFVCLVADLPHGMEVMMWSLTKVFPFKMHPKDCIVSYQLGGERDLKTPFQANARWINSNRIGVLHQEGETRWIISWFEGDRTKVKNKSILFGGGQWEVSMSMASEEQILSPKQLRDIGL